MLTQFNVKNYKSIAEELSLDFTAMKGMRDNPPFVVDYNGLHILPVAALFGNNASGKTNILDALVTMGLLVLHREIDLDWEDCFPVPYLFDQKISVEPSTFEAFWAVADKEYQYGFSLLDGKVKQEWLFVKKIPKRPNSETKWKSLLERDGQRFSFGTEKQNRLLSPYTHLMDERLLALSFLAGRDIAEIAPYSTVYDQFQQMTPFSSPRSRYDISVENYARYPESLKEASAFVRDFDPTFEALTMETIIAADGKEKVELKSVHKGKRYPISFESEGTQKLIALWVLVWMTLQDGCVLIVDELDCQLHPLILKRIVRIFHDKKTNPNHAQLIFSSHNLIVLDRHDLRRDEIWFVEKDGAGRSTTSSLGEYRLDEKRFRSDTDYSKHYLAGRFGAIPFQAAAV